MMPRGAGRPGATEHHRQSVPQVSRAIARIVPRALWHPIFIRTIRVQAHRPRMAQKAVPLATERPESVIVIPGGYAARFARRAAIVH